jgi:uncharacterized protein
VTGPGEPLALAHLPTLSPLLRSLAVPLSEFCFSNLFLFRAAHAWELARGPAPFLRGRTYAGESFLMPLFDPRAADPRLLAAALLDPPVGSAPPSFFFPIPEEWLPAFPPRLWGRESRRGDSDYLYRVTTMCALPGKALHRKRNLVAQFRARHRHEARPMRASDRPAALEVLEAWGEESGQKPEETDFAACREAVERMDELGLEGGIVFADGEPAGFVLGEGLTEDVFALHFAKGKTRFSGIYQFLFSNTSCLLPERYLFLNLEQDLDREPLRAAKESYRPERLLSKYRVSPG